MKKTRITMSRRQILKTGVFAGAGMMLPWSFNRKAYAEALSSGLSDPALQPKFVEIAPNALDPAFLFKDLNQNGGPAYKPNFSVRAKEAIQETGLINPRNGRRLKTKIWGYRNDTVT
jgi:spore coat protein A